MSNSIHEDVDFDSPMESLEPENFDVVQRRNVIKELITTEGDYVKDLNVLINIFMVPLEESGIISYNESNILFSNIQDLLEINLGKGSFLFNFCFFIFIFSFFFLMKIILFQINKRCKYFIFVYFV